MPIRKCSIRTIRIGSDSWKLSASPSAYIEGRVLELGRKAGRKELDEQWKALRRGWYVGGKGGSPRIMTPPAWRGAAHPQDDALRARPLRIEYPGAVQHVITRGSHGHAIFADNQDRKRFLETLGESCQKTSW